MAQAARLDQPLDVVPRQEIVEPAALVALDDERPALPVLGEELLLLDGLDAAT